MGYRVNLEEATLVFENNELKVYPEDAPGFTAELSDDSGYYRELRYFIEHVAQGEPVTVCTPESAPVRWKLLKPRFVPQKRTALWRRYLGNKWYLKFIH